MNTLKVKQLANKEGLNVLEDSIEISMNLALTFK